MGLTDPQAGSGTLVVLAVIVMLLLITSVLVAAIDRTVMQHRAQIAADFAALAGAHVPAVGCAKAAAVAPEVIPGGAQRGIRVGSCAQLGEVVWVQVIAPSLLGQVAAVAEAGPPF